MGVVFNSSIDSPWGSVLLVVRKNFMKTDSARLLVVL